MNARPASRPASRAVVHAFGVLVWLAPAAAFAQSNTGTVVGEFLKIEPSARIAAMGNTGVALDMGLDAVYYNPGAIGSVDGFTLQLDHSSWLAGISYEYVAAAMPLGTWGNGYASITALNSGDIDVRTVSQPLGTGERFNVSNIALALGFGRSITDRFSAGVQVNYVQETIYHSSAGSFAINAGTLYSISDQGLRIGASLSNFGTSQAFDGRDLRVTYDQNPDINGDNGTLPATIFTEGFSLPVLFRVGLGMPFRLSPEAELTVAVVAEHPNDNSESMSAGAELQFRRMLAVRAGWQNAFQEDAEVGLTLGAGFQGKYETIRYALDYAWADHGRLGDTQRFALGLHF